MLFYLIGIKGSAMSALAKILYQQGHMVTGVDVENDFYTMKNLENISLENFNNMQLKRHYFYIIGNAYKNHSVTNYIKHMKYYTLEYPQFLTKHFRKKSWICVAGTHGKTTTTKMLATLLPNSTCLIGDGSAQENKKGPFIVEACEYRNTFLNYNPSISVILNVDYDHVDFFKSKEAYKASFITFVKQSKISIINGDEFDYRGSNVITFGMKQGNDVVFSYSKGTVTILRKVFNLPVIGEKYAYDFVGAYLAAKLSNCRDWELQQRISQFTMPRRRYEKKIMKEQTIICDYGHHPAEIKAIYDAVKEEHPKQKVICIFEPHTISRLQCFIEDFKTTLSLFDECYLYALFSSVREAHNLVLEKQLYKYLDFPLYDYTAKTKLLSEKNIVLCFMGAGDIDKAYQEYTENLHRVV